jgi:hypothetical protein
MINVADGYMITPEVLAFGQDLVVELASYPNGVTDPPCEEHKPLVTAMATVIAANSTLGLDIARHILMAAYRLGQISMETPK